MKRAPSPDRVGYRDGAFSSVRKTSRRRTSLHSAEPERVRGDSVAVFTLSGTGIDEDERLAKDARELVKVFRVDGAGRGGRIRTVRDLRAGFRKSVSEVSLAWTKACRCTDLSRDGHDEGRRSGSVCGSCRELCCQFRRSSL